MDVLIVSVQFPSVPLLGGTMNKPGVPSERYGDGASVGELHREDVVGDRDRHLLPKPYHFQLHVRDAGATRATSPVTSVR